METTIEKNDYTYIINGYKREGLNMMFADGRISRKMTLGEMKCFELEYYIDLLSPPVSLSDKAWCKVLSDVVHKQRRLKIEKIKNGINHNKSTR
jgi:hypothetical protein